MTVLPGLQSYRAELSVVEIAREEITALQRTEESLSKMGRARPKVHWQRWCRLAAPLTLRPDGWLKRSRPHHPTALH